MPYTTPGLVDRMAAFLAQHLLPVAAAAAPH